MPEAVEQQKTEQLDALVTLLHEGTLAQVRERLAEMHPGEIALLLESLPQEDRDALFQLLPLDAKGRVLVDLSDEVRRPLLRPMAPQELVEATKGLELDDLADFLQDLPDSVISQVIRSFDAQLLQRVEEVLAYPEDSAGGLMNTDAIAVRADIKLDVVLRYLRWQGEIPPATDSLMVVDREGKYLGALTLTDLLLKDPGLRVEEIYSTQVEAIPADMAANNVAKMFERRDLVSAPVVNADGRLVGRITVDDVVDVIREEADHSFMSMAGLSEESDVFAPVVTSSRRRALWLGVNLITALLASWVIGQFDETIEKLVALAVLMPVVASMGGIAGSQTLTLVIRGMAVGHVSDANARRLLAKEFAVGALNGTIWAIVVALVAVAWFDDWMLGAIIAAAILVNLICAAIAGTVIPLILRRMGIDPALAGGVVLTTVTDVVGFLAFLGLAALVLVK